MYDYKIQYAKISVVILLFCTGRMMAENPFTAVKSGSLVALQASLDANADLEQQNADGETLMTLATSAGHVDLVQYLLERGAKVDGLNGKKDCPLEVAVRNHQLPVVELLIGRGAEINKQLPNGSTPLYLAVEIRDIAIVKYLIEHGADVDLCESRGFAPIHYAAEHENADILDVLIEAGADPNILNQKKVEPLLCAAYKGRLVNVRKLISAGAVLHLNKQNNLLQAAQASGNPALTQYLLTYIKNPPVAVIRQVRKKDPLKTAVMTGDVAEVERLLKEDRYQQYETLVSAIALARQIGRLDVEERLSAANAKNAEQIARWNQLGNELVSAIVGGKYQLVDGLLARGADPNYCNSSGEHVLRTAISMCKDDAGIVRLLMQKGADPLLISAKITSIRPLYAAAEKGRIDLVQLVLTGRESFEQLNWALWLGVANPKSSEMARLLISKGANPNYATKERVTVLHQAAGEGDLEVVKLLLAAGASLNVRNSQGQIPADMAASSNRQDIVSALRAAGSAVPTARKKNPLFKEVTYGKLDQVKTLVAEGNSVNDTTDDPYYTTAEPYSLLRCAILYGSNGDIVSYLLDQKATGEPSLLIDLVSRANSFPAHAERLIDQMVQNGFDVNVKLTSGQTALMVATWSNHPRIVAKLIKLGGKVDAADTDGKTVLQYARKAGNKDVIKMIEDAGAKK